MDTEEIQTLRSSIPKNIIITLSNGEQIEVGRCGFVPFNITEMQNRYFDSDNTDREYPNLNIPVAFHVVYPAGGESNTDYNVPDYKLDLQIDVLNGIYMGNDPGYSLSQPGYDTPGGTESGLYYYNYNPEGGATTRTENSNWFNNTGQYESQMKQTLAIDPVSVINVYITACDGWLGWSYFPNDFPEGNYMHGPVINYISVPEGASSQYGYGRTLTHELGHFYGLYHTFQSACSSFNDGCDDTPAQSDGNNIYTCNDNLDTCIGGGSDPVHNYMNYTDDLCLTEFTDDQFSRAWYYIETYKPGFIEANEGGMPSLQYSPGSFDVSLNPDQISTDNLTISNVGEADSELNYSISVSPFENTGGGPDAEGTLWADSDNESSIPVDWIDITVVGTQVTFPNNDEAADPVSIGFDFPFYGETYSQCIVNANGWVGFGSDNNAWDNTSIPSTSAPRPAIFGFWDDLNPVNDQCNQYCSGNVYYHSDSERLVIWFDEVAHWWTDFEDSFYSFQVILYPSGDVNLNYGPITGTHTATIGMQNESGTVGLQVSYNDSYVHEDLSVHFTKEPVWVTVSPDQGEIDAGNFESIDVTFSSEGLTNGEYTANLNINSNGGSATLPVTLTVSGETQNMPVSYLEDWNLIGLPLAADETDYLELFPDALNGTLYAYYGIYQEVYQLIVGQGYWLRFSQQGSASVSGSPVSSLSLSLMEGWNLITGISVSVPYDNISDPESIMVSGTLYGYNGTYYNASSVDPGNGYWIRAGSSGSISLSASGQNRSQAGNSDNNLPEMSSIIFTNNSGYSSTLYCDMPVSENDKLSFSLPPVPPASGFDIRFAGDMKLVENGGEIFIQNELWPMYVKLGMKEDRSEKKEWILVDEVNGKKYSFNESGTIEISEPTERLTLYRKLVIPEHFALYQNYPNPFNPITNIRYDLPKDSDVILAVYDLLGREVAVLINGEMASGSYTVAWDGSNYSSGIYFCKLSTDFGHLTNKMVLLK